MNEEMMRLGRRARVEAEWIESWPKIRATTAMEPFGVELRAVDDERMVIEFAISDAARQPMGLLHGGVSLLMAESAASMHSAWLADLSESAPVGLEISGSHLRSASDGIIRTTARVLRRTRAFVFHEVDIEHAETDRLLCRARVTNYLRPHRQK